MRGSRAAAAPGPAARGLRWLRVAGVVALAAGVAWFARTVAVSGALARWRDLPAWLLLLVPATAAPIAMGTRSWALSFPRHGAQPARRPGFRRLFAIRLAGEAVNNLLFSAYVAGEPVKGMLAARHGPSAPDALASALIGKTAFVLGEIVLLALGMALAGRFFAGSEGLVEALAYVTAGGLIVIAAGVVLQKRQLVGRGARLLGALRLAPRHWFERAPPQAEAIDRALVSYWRLQRGDFARAVAWAAAGWIVGAGELWVFLHVATGVRDPLALALVLEAAIAVTKGLSFFVPGSLGVQEGGIAALFQACGAGAEAGVLYALFRRVRELSWIGLGFAALGWQLRRPR